MPKFSGVPTYESSLKHSNNGISRVVIGFGDHLPRYGWEWTPNLNDADLRVYHAGEGNGNSVDVAVVHGLHSTGHHDLNPSQALFEINRLVIQDMVIAKQIIAPSNWVADYIRHEFKRDVTVVNWGVDLDKWEPLESDEIYSYVLWNKNRSDPVCNPAHMNQVARRMPHIRFMSTFGEPFDNVKIIGRRPWDEMNMITRNAGVYLATTRETGDIGSREALAAGVPVVAFAWGGVVDVVKHGVNGYLAEVGNYDELAHGIEWCFQHREQLRANALGTRDSLGWDAAAERVAMVFDEALAEKQAKRPKVSVVIPCHNYEQFVGRAIESVLNQQTNFEFEVVVILDRCTDNSENVVMGYRDRFANVYMGYGDFGSPALTRNHGIALSDGQYVLCLDADDQIAPNTLQILADAMDADATLGIAYTGLGLEHGGQTGFPPSNPSFELMVSGYNQIPTCCMFRREDWQRVGGYRQYMEPSEDADFFMRLWAWSGRYAKQVTPAPLFIYNVHQGSLTDEYRSQVRQPDPFTRRGAVSWLKQRPIPALPIGNNKSNPVYHRDLPLLDVRIADKNAILIRDSLDFQFFRDWKEESHVSPLIIRFNGDEWLPDNYLNEQLKALEFPPDDGVSVGIIMGKVCCGGSRVNYTSVPLTDENTVLVQFIGGGMGGIYIPSPSGWKPSADIPATKAYGKKRQGDVFRMLKKDYDLKPDQFKIITEQVALEAIRTVEPIELDTPPVSMPPMIDDDGWADRVIADVESVKYVLDNDGGMVKQPMAIEYPAKVRRGRKPRK